MKMDFVVLGSSKKTGSKIRDYSAEVKLFYRRTLVAFLVIIASITILLANLTHLQIFNFNYYSTKSNNNRIEIIPIPPNRGLIYDRNGTILANNRSTYQLNMIPDKINDLDQEFEKLKKIIDLTDEDIEAFNKERSNYKAYRSVPLKKNLTEVEINRFSVNQHLFPFVSIKQILHRLYPYGSSLTPVLGYVSKINTQDQLRLAKENKSNLYTGTTTIGKMGIERYYEDILHGEPGYEEVEVDSRGRIVRQLTSSPPKKGEDIYISINLKLQMYIEKLLAGHKAAVVALDPNNGEVLALVSSPTYDGNAFVDGISNKNYNALLSDPKKPLYNRALLGTYPPASTVKPYMAIAALTEKIITAKTVRNDPGWWQLPGTTKRYRDWLRWGHGKVDVNKAIAESVDTFFYQIAFDMGIDRISKWMEKFGYGERTGIDISAAEESKGILPNREWKRQRYKQSWLQGDTIPIGIGQGYWTATPLQLAKSLTILINEGKIYTPHLLLFKKSDLSQANFPTQKDTKIENNVLKEVNATYWKIAKKGMYDVMFSPRGTAHKIYENAPYRAAGKSGTAQVYGLKDNETYDSAKIPEHLRDHAIFVAYAPYENPTIALAIVLENGGSGSSNGGAVAKKILDFYLLGDDSTELNGFTYSTGMED